MAPGDAGLDGGGDSGSCACDDGLFCNGAERCVEGACEPGESPCAAGTTCNEDEERCETECDADGDGHESIECGGDDCDDADPNRYTGNLELCDPEGHDEDCDPATLGPDGDGDGHPSRECCNLNAAGDRVCGGDCDDTRSGVHPGAADGCGGGDQDCDGRIDEEPDSTFYRDQDGDNYGDPSDSLEACSQPSGYAARGDDCVDDPFANPDANEINPGATEVCDGVDNDCDGGIDEGLTCECTSPGLEEDCGIDPALDGIGICRLGTHTCRADGSWSTCVGLVAPRAEECNGLDDDCDGLDDEAEGLEVVCYLDADGDSYAAPGASALPSACPVSPTMPCSPGYTDRDPAVSADCDDSDPTIHPGAPEVCDRIDQNCSRTTASEVELAEDYDGDGHTSSTYDGCTGGFPKDDCNDFNPNIHPGAPARATGYCAPGQCLCSGNNLCTNSLHPTTCLAGCSGSVAPQFDYNCDGVATRVPSRDAMCGCRPGFSCADDGVSYAGAPACGSAVTHWSCGSGTCGAPTCARTTWTAPLPCR